MGAQIFYFVSKFLHSTRFSAWTVVSLEKKLTKNNYFHKLRGDIVNPGFIEFAFCFFCH